MLVLLIVGRLVKERNTRLLRYFQAVKILIKAPRSGVSSLQRPLQG